MAPPGQLAQVDQSPLGVIDHDRSGAVLGLAGSALGQVGAGASGYGRLDVVVTVTFGHDRHEQGTSTNCA